MAKITLVVEDNSARAVVTDGPITAGTVGIPVEIVTDESWAGLRQTLVCMTALDKIPILEPNEETSKVPWELLIQGYHLYLSLEGRSADGSRIENSTWADCGKVQASGEGSHTGKPTPNEMEQLMNIAENIILVQDEQPVERENKAWVTGEAEEFEVTDVDGNTHVIRQGAVYFKDPKTGEYRLVANALASQTTEEMISDFAAAAAVKRAEEIRIMDERGEFWKNNGIPETATEMQEDITALKQDFADVKAIVLETETAPEMDISKGFIATNGGAGQSDTRIRCNTYIKCRKGSEISVDAGYKYRVAMYTDPLERGWYKNNTSTFSTAAYTIPDDCYIRFTIAKADDSVIQTDEISHAHLSIVTGTIREVTDTLNEGFNIIDAEPELKTEYGFIATNGYADPNISQTRIRNVKYIQALAGSTITADSGYKFRVAKYADTLQSAFIGNNTQTFVSGTYALDEDCYIRFTLARSDDGDMTLEDISHIHFAIKKGTVRTVVDKLAPVVNSLTAEVFDAADLSTAKVPYIRGFIGLDIGLDYNASTTRLCTPNYIKVFAGDSVSVDNPAYGFRVAMYKVTNYNSLYRNSVHSGFSSEKYTIPEDCYIRVTLRRNDDAEMDIAEASHLVFDITSTRDNNAMLDIFRKPFAAWNAPVFGAEYRPSDGDYGLFNYDTPVTDILSAWDALVEESGGYLTKTVMGKDQSGTYDIIKINAAAPTNLTVLARPHYTKPKLLLVSNLHGFEKASAIAVYYLFRDLVRGWRNNPVLQYLRQNVEIVCLPVLNPWGWMANTYGVSNHVNINRTFPVGFIAVDPSDGTNYGGPEPLSCAEARYLKQVIDSNADALYYTDFHTTGQAVTAANKTPFTYNNVVKQAMPDGTTAINRYAWWLTKRSIDYCDSVFSADLGITTYRPSYDIISEAQGHGYAYAQSIGLYGEVVEIPCNLPGETVMYSADFLRNGTRYIGQWLQFVLEHCYNLND